MYWIAKFDICQTSKKAFWLKSPNLMPTTFSLNTVINQLTHNINISWSTSHVSINITGNTCVHSSIVRAEEIVEWTISIRHWHILSDITWNFTVSNTVGGPHVGESPSGPRCLATEGELRGGSVLVLPQDGISRGSVHWKNADSKSCRGNFSRKY